MHPPSLINPEDIVRVYRIHFLANGNLYRQLAGRFIQTNGEVWVLEDPFKLLAPLSEGGDQLTEKKWHLIESMANASYLELKREGDPEAGEDPEHPTEVPEARFGGAGSGDASTTATDQVRPPSVFDYHRVGMDAPQCLEVYAGQPMLNGHAISSEEMQRILQNLQEGTASLRYRATAALPAVQKMETVFEQLNKAEGGDKDLFGVMEHLRGLADKGHISPEHLETLHRNLYGDQLVPDVGNKRAYQDFLSRPKEGVHVMMDANDFKSINDELGHDVGDKAIKHMGGAMRQAMDETVGRDQGKLFRFGGDEFAAHLPSGEHAARFARALRAKLEAIPALGGTHRLSVSMGLGHTPQHADKALNEHAKAAKNDAIQAITGVHGSRQKVRAPEALYAHSLIPGHEGAVPTGERPSFKMPPPAPTLGLQVPPKPAAAPAAPAAPTAGAPGPAAAPRPQA
jgi:diguanylate cyclase (GGDEF)-like protein